MACEFKVKVVGKKGHLRWERGNNEHLDVYVTAEPLSEDANREILTSLAEALSLSRSHVRLIHGVEDHLKLFKITDHDTNFDEVLVALGLVAVEEAD